MSMLFSSVLITHHEIFLVAIFFGHPPSDNKNVLADEHW